jgi:hypothetical protein
MRPRHAWPSFTSLFKLDSETQGKGQKLVTFGPVQMR